MNGEPMPNNQPAKPTFLKPDISNMPEELCGLDQWVLWKAVFKDGEWTKIPFNPKTGGFASSTKPDTWGSIEAACHKLGTGKYDGIGFVVSTDDAITGIDLDHCRTRDPDTGEMKIARAAEKIIKSIASYTEISPGGAGVRIFTLAKLPPTGRKKGNIELYDSKRFLTTTGHVLMGLHKIRPRQTEINQLHKEVFGEQKVINIEQAKASKKSHLADEKIIEKAFAASNGDKFQRLYNGDTTGHPSPSEADLALCSMLAFWCNCDPDQIDRIFKSSGLCREKWERPDYSQRTIDKAISDCTETYQGSRSEKPAPDPPPEPPPEPPEPEPPPATEADEERAAIQAESQEVEKEAEQKIFDFPDQVLTGAVGNFVEVYNGLIESCPQFLYMAYLACLGNVLCPKLSVRTTLKTQPRLYVVLVGESADDRKSTAIDAAVDFFRLVLDRDFHYSEGVGSAEGLQRILRKAEEQYADQATGTLLVHDEFKAFVSKCNIDNSVLLPCVNTLFEKTRYENSVKKNEIIIEKAHLSMLAASTIETYERIYKPHFFHIGFPNRIFLVPGTTQRKYSLPDEIPSDANQQIKKELINILKFTEGGVRYDLTEEAREYYQHWYLNRDNSVHVKRMETYSLRLMMLMAANEMKQEIDLDITQKATALCDWQVEVRKLYDPIDADSIYAQMEEKIRRHLKNGSLKDWELKRKTGANRAGLHVYLGALNLLQKVGEVGKVKAKNVWFLKENQDYSTSSQQ